MAFTRRMTVLAACALIGCKTPMGATTPQATVSLVESRANALDGPLENVSPAPAKSHTCRQLSPPTSVMAKVVAYQSENSPSTEPPLPAAGPVASDPLEPLSDNTPSSESESTDLPIPEAGNLEIEKPNTADAVNVGDGVSVGVDSSVPAKATAASLTLQQLEELALANSPALSEAAARVESLRGNWVQVGLPPNTVLGYSGQQIFSGGAAEQQGLYVGQQFVRGGKLQLNRAVVAQEVRKAETEWQAQRQRVLTDVRLGYYEVLIAQRRNQVAEELVRIAEQAVTTAESLLEAREVSQVDVMRARVELQTDELLLKNARNQQQSAWSRLVAVLGQPNMQITTLAGNLEGSLQKVDMEETVARLMVNSPQLIAAGIEVDRARSILRRQRVEPVPDVDVQAIAQNDNATDGSNAAVQVTFPLPWLDRNQGAIQQAYANLVAAERATNRMELKLQKRLATVYQTYANASNQVEDYSKSGGILENSRRTLEYVGKGYRAGEIGYLDLLTAQRTYAATNLAYLEALGELWSALVEIDGLLLRDSLEEDRGGINAGN